MRFHTVEKISFSGDLMILEMDSRRLKSISAKSRRSSPPRRPNADALRNLTLCYGITGRNSTKICPSMACSAYNIFQNKIRRSVAEEATQPVRGIPSIMAALNTTCAEPIIQGLARRPSVVATLVHC